MHRTISAPNLQNLDESSPTDDLNRTPSETSTSTSTLNDGFGFRNPEPSGTNPENPKISSRRDFVANTNLNKYVGSSNLSLKAQDSKLQTSVNSIKSDAIRRYLSSSQSLEAQDSNQSENTINSEAIRQYLSKYIYHKPLLEIEHWLEYQIFPLELQPLNRTTKSSPSYELQSPKPSNFDESFIEDFRNNPDAYREILGSSPDDSVISGLITLTEAKPRPKTFYYPKAKTTMPEGTFYNRNVIVAPSPDSYEAENYKILKKPEVSKYIRMPYEKMILKPETDRPLTHRNVSKFLVPSASVKSTTGTLNLVRADYSFASPSVFLQSSGNLFPESRSEEVCRNKVCQGGNALEEEPQGKVEVEEVEAAAPTQKVDSCCACKKEDEVPKGKSKKTEALPQKDSKEIERYKREESKRAKEAEKFWKEELKKEAERNRKEEVRLKKEEEKRKKEEVKRRKEEEKKRREEEKIRARMVKVPCDCKAERKPDGSCVCAGKTKKPKSCECKPEILPCEDACGTTCEAGYFGDDEIAPQETYEDGERPPPRVRISLSKASRKSLPKTESRLIRNSFVFDQNNMVEEQTGQVHASPDKKVQISDADSRMMMTPIVETDIETRDDFCASKTCAPLKCRQDETEDELKEDTRDEIYSAPPRKPIPKCSSSQEGYLQTRRKNEVFAAPPGIEETFEETNRGEVYAAPPGVEETSEETNGVEETFEETARDEVFAAPPGVEETFEETNRDEVFAAPPDVEETFEETNRDEVFAAPPGVEETFEETNGVEETFEETNRDEVFAAPPGVEETFDETNRDEVFAAPNKPRGSKTSSAGLEGEEESLAQDDFEQTNSKRESVENQGELQAAQSSIIEEQQVSPNVSMRTVGEETETVQKTSGAQVFAAPPMIRNDSRSSRRTLVCEGVGTSDDGFEKECDPSGEICAEKICAAKEQRSHCECVKLAKKGRRSRTVDEIEEEEEDVVVEDKRGEAYAAPVRRNSKVVKCQDRSKRRRSGALEQQHAEEDQALPPPPRWRSSRTDKSYFPDNRQDYSNVFDAPPPPKRSSSRRRSYTYVDEDEFEAADRPEVFAAPPIRRRSSKTKHPCGADCRGRVGFCEGGVAGDDGSCGSRASCRINLSDVIQDEIQRASVAKVQSAPPKRKSVSDSLEEEEEEEKKAKCKEVTCTVCKSCLSVGKAFEENLQATVQRLVESAAPTKKSSVESFDSHAKCHDTKRNNRQQQAGMLYAAPPKQHAGNVLMIDNFSEPEKSPDDARFSINLDEKGLKDLSQLLRLSQVVQGIGRSSLDEGITAAQNQGVVYAAPPPRRNSSSTQNEGTREPSNNQGSRRQSISEVFDDPKNEGQVFAAPPARDPSRSQYSTGSRRQTVSEVFDDARDEGQVFAAPPARDPSRSQYSTASRRQTVSEVFDDARNEGQVFAAPPPRDPSKSQYSTASRRQTVDEVFDDTRNEGQVFAAPPARDPSRSQYSTVSRRQTISEVFDDPKNEGQVFAAPPARDPSRSQYSTASRRQTVSEVFDDAKNEGQVFAAPPARDPSRSQYSTGSRRQTVSEVFDAPKNEGEVFAAPPSRRSQYSTSSRRQTLDEVFDESQNQGQVYAALPPRNSQYSRSSTRRETVDEVFDESENQRQVYAAPPPRRSQFSPSSSGSRRQTVDEVFDESENQGQVYSAPPPRRSQFSPSSSGSRRQTVDEVFDESENQGQVYSAPPARRSQFSPSSSGSRRQSVNQAYDAPRNEGQVFSAPPPRNKSRSQFSPSSSGSRRQTVDEVFDESENQGQVYSAPPPRRSQFSPSSSGSRRQSVDEAYDAPRNEGQVFSAPPPRNQSRSQFSPSSSGSRRKSVDEVYDAPRNEDQVFSAPPPRTQSRSQYTPSSSASPLDEISDERKIGDEVYASPPSSEYSSSFRSPPTSSESRRETVDELLDGPQNETQVYAPPPSKKSQQSYRRSTMDGRNTLSEIYHEPRSSQSRKTVEEIFDGPQAQAQNFSAPPPKTQMGKSCSVCKNCPDCKPCPCPKREDYNEQRMFEKENKPEIFAEVKRRLDTIENQRPCYCPKNPVGDKLHSVSSAFMKKSQGEIFAAAKKTSSSKCSRVYCDPKTCGEKLGNVPAEPTVSYQKTELSEKLQTAYTPYTEISSLKKIDEEDLTKITTSNVLIQVEAAENKGSQTIVDAGTSTNRPLEEKETATSIHAIAPIPEEAEPQTIDCTVCDACVGEKLKSQSRLSKFFNSAKPKKSRTSQVSQTEIEIQPKENDDVFAELPPQDKTLLFSQTDEISMSRAAEVYAGYATSEASQAPEIELQAKSKKGKLSRLGDWRKMFWDLAKGA